MTIATPNKKDQLSALDELFKRSAEYRNSSNFFELLKFINKFPLLSVFNAFLIHMQNNGVEIVMTERRWQKYGRTVKRNARPLVILVPFGPVDFVYDIADTDGDQLPDYLQNPFVTKGNLPEEVLIRTKLNCASDQIRCLESNMHKGSAGYATEKKGDYFEVTVNRSYGLNEQYSTLSHELAHIYAGHFGKNENSWWEARIHLDNQVEEIEAESIAFLACTRIGLQTSSEVYLSDYVKGNDLMPTIGLDTILKASSHIESLGKKGFKPKKGMKS